MPLVFALKERGREDVNIFIDEGRALLVYMINRFNRGNPAATIYEEKQGEEEYR